MGGGFPAAAFGGRADVMSLLAPDGPVYQAGTLSGNPVATTAGLATLRLATDDVYAHLDRRRATTVKQATTEALDRRRRAAPCRARGHDVLGVPRPRAPVRDFADASPHRRRRLRRRSSTPCSTHGVYLPPSAFEAWFLSSAHDDRAVRAASSTRCPARRGRRPPPDRGSAVSAHDHPRHRRPPAPPRRGAQPGRRALRPPRRLPPLRPRPADGRAGGRVVRRPRHRAPAVVAARAGAGDRRAAGRGPAARGHDRRAGASSRSNKFEGTPFGDGRQRAAAPAHLVAAAQPVEAVVGRALQGDRRRG